MREGTKFEHSGHVVVYVRVDAALTTAVEHRSRRAAADEAAPAILPRRVRQLSGPPDVVAMAADDMDSRIAIGLRMYEQHVLAKLGDERVLAGQRVDATVEYDVARNQLVHGIERVGKRIGMRWVGLEVALLIARHVHVLLADVVDPIVRERLGGAGLESVTWVRHDDASHT